MGARSHSDSTETKTIDSCGLKSRPTTRPVCSGRNTRASGLCRSSPALRSGWIRRKPMRRRMADLLLDSIKRAHRLRSRLRTLTPQQREIVKRELGDEIANEWFLTAREAQLPPPDDGWTIWLFMAGRGSGKTHAASNLIHMAVEAGVKDIGLIGPNAGHLDAVNLDGA